MPAMQSAKADFVPFQRRIHSLLELARRSTGKTCGGEIQAEGHPPAAGEQIPHSFLARNDRLLVRVSISPTSINLHPQKRRGPETNPARASW
jgi:hypothetical protein